MEQSQHWKLPGDSGGDASELTHPRAKEANGIYLSILAVLYGRLPPGAEVPGGGLSYVQLEQAPGVGDCPLAETHRSL